METLTTQEPANVTGNGAQATNGQAAALIPATPEAAVNFTLSDDPATRNAQIHALARAPKAVQDVIMRAAAEAMAGYYAESLATDGELTEFTVALQGEDFYEYKEADFADQDGQAPVGAAVGYMP